MRVAGETGPLAHARAGGPGHPQLPGSLSSQVCVAPLALRGSQSRVSDSAMIDKPEARAGCSHVLGSPIKAQRPNAPPGTPDRHLPQRTVSMRRVVTDFDNSEKLMPRRFPPPWSGEGTDGGLLVTDVDPAAVSRAPYPAASVASTAATAAS